MSILSARKISKEEKLIFDEKGYVVIPGFFSAEDIAPLREAYDTLVKESEEAHGGMLKGKMIQRAGMASSWEEWKNKEYLQQVVHAGRELLGEDIDFAYDQIIMKPAGNSGSTPWHQDAGYWYDPAHEDPLRQLMAERALTCWLALSEVTADHGCMQFIPGSHKQGLVEHADVSHRSAINGAKEAVGVDESKAVKVTMHPGDLSFHHCRTLHYTTGNEADTPRCGLVMHLGPHGGPQGRK